MNKITDKKYLLVSHYATYAMQDLLYEYLTNKKVAFVKKINFPLPELPFLKKIEIEDNTKGNTTSKLTVFSLLAPLPVAYFVHFLQLLWLVLSDKTTYDIVIAENSLLTLTCILLKKLRRVKKIIFYSHGVAGNRFHISFINRIYQWMDVSAAQNSDLNWLLSKKMIDVRLQQGVERKNIFWVPTALQLSKMKRNDTPKKDALIFLGAFNEMNGVNMLPKIMEVLQKEFPSLHLDIIGDGPLKDDLEKSFQKDVASGRVTFLGVQRFDDYRTTLSDYVAGLAPYKPSVGNLLQSTDPMKIRLYMAAGLPTVTTKGFPFSKEIIANNLGFAVEYVVDSYSKAIKQLLENKKEYLLKRKNNLMYSVQFDQENIFREPLERLIDE